MEAAIKIANGVLVEVLNRDLNEGHFVFPGQVTSIGVGAFYCCSKLDSIFIPGSVTSIGANAFGNLGLTSITISNNVTSIGASAFSCCSNVTSVVIPGSVSSIGSNAFFNCNNLISLTIPDSVMSIGKDAFFACNKLSVIHIDANSQDGYRRIYAMLPANIQQKIQICYESFKENAVLFLKVRNHGPGFFRQNSIPEDINYQLLINLATQYGIPPCMVNQASQKFDMDVELSRSEVSRDMTY